MKQIGEVVSAHIKPNALELAGHEMLYFRSALPTHHSWVIDYERLSTQLPYPTVLIQHLG